MFSPKNFKFGCLKILNQLYFFIIFNYNMKMTKIIFALFTIANITSMFIYFEKGQNQKYLMKNDPEVVIPLDSNTYYVEDQNGKPYINVPVSCKWKKTSDGKMYSVSFSYKDDEINTKYNKVVEPMTDDENIDQKLTNMCVEDNHRRTKRFK
jgi:hypothetical protein